MLIMGGKGVYENSVLPAQLFANLKLLKNKDNQFKNYLRQANINRLFDIKELLILGIIMELCALYVHVFISPLFLSLYL